MNTIILNCRSLSYAKEPVQEGESMSKFNVSLSYKNICILKHSLRNRIENDTADYELMKQLEENLLTEKGKIFIKEYEEHVRCFNALCEELECVGYRHGRNIFKR